MAQDSTNPFVLPGFGQQGEAAHNPLFAGLDMMRQAWQNMAAPGRLEASALAPMSLEDLDRRIRELQTVQNWLQLNASMLASTIQGLEIQRSTLATLKSFAGGAFPGAHGGDAAAAPAGAGAPAADSDAAGQAYAQAAGDWWNLMQQQFEQLAAATTASLQGMAEAAETAQAASAEDADPGTKKSARSGAAGARTAAGKTARTTATKTAKTARKPRS